MVIQIPDAYLSYYKYYVSDCTNRTHSVQACSRLLFYLRNTLMLFM